MDEKNEAALRGIRHLLRHDPGKLRIITNEVRPTLREDKNDPRSFVRPEILESNPNALRSHHTFVCHDAVAVEGPNERGLIAVTSKEGDACMGRPVDVLARLLEAHNTEEAEKAGDSI